MNVLVVLAAGGDEGEARGGQRSGVGRRRRRRRRKGQRGMRGAVSFHPPTAANLATHALGRVENASLTPCQLRGRLAFAR